MTKISIDNNLLSYFNHFELRQIADINNLYLKTKVIVSVLFKYKYDKSGKPYIEHLTRVSNKLNEEIEKIAGLLHDVLEDTDVTEKDLLEVGIPKEVIEIVKLVTHEKIDKSNMTEEEKLDLYNKDIDRVINSGNIHAIRLKEADMTDNYNPERLKELSEESQTWFHKKYGKQLVKLRNFKGDDNI